MGAGASKPALYPSPQRKQGNSGRPPITCRTLLAASPFSSTTCAHRLRQLALGAATHENARGFLPLLDRSWILKGYRPASGNVEFFGYIVHLYPYIEEQSNYDQFTSFITTNDPAPWSSPLPGLTIPPEGLHCPSDSGARPKSMGGRGPTKSYLANRGDTMLDYGDNPTRSPFTSGWSGTGSGVMDQRNIAVARVRTRDILDGTRETILLSERCVGAVTAADRRVKSGIATGVTISGTTKPQVCLDQVGANGYSTTYTSGATQARWASREGTNNFFYTILPPNGPSCASGGGSSDGFSNDWALMTATSYHSPGGVNVAMTDASVRFVSDTIDAGDPNQNPTLVGSSFKTYRGRSQWGVWGALGTTRGGETIAPD